MPTINNRFENLTLERLQEIYDIVSVPVSTGLTVGVTTITGGTVGRVLFQGTGNVLQQSSNLFWDNTNIRLGVGVTPIRTLHVQHIGTTGVTGSLLFWNQDNSYTSLSVLSNGAGFSLSGHTNGTGYISATSSINITNNNGTNPSVIWLGNGSRFRLNNPAETETYLVVANTGNVLINTTTDAGFKLDVNGSARIGNASYYLTLANGGADGGILRVGGASYGYAELVSYSLRLNGGHSLYGTGGTNEFGLSSLVTPIASAVANKGAIVFKADNAGTGGGTWAAYPNALAFNFLKKETTGLYTSLLALNGNTNNVGIGTVNPTSKFFIYTDNTSSTIGDNNAFIIHNNNPNWAATGVGNLTELFFSDAGQGSGTTNGLNLAHRYAGISAFITGWNGTSSAGGLNLITKETTASALSIRLQIRPNGNVLINTTTDAGYKLDVNGSARIGGVASGSAALHLKGQSGFGQYLYFDNGTGNGLWTMVGGTVFAFDSATTRIWRISPSAQVTINGNTNIGSAQLQVDSTTRGFLPPRMTTAEKNGITSLVAGLIVYDATLNKLCVYTGTVWETITSA